VAVIDKTKTWRLVEERLAAEADPRRIQILEVVLEHMKAEAAPDMDRLMATVAEDADYHFWGPTGDTGPKGRADVRAYYEAFVASGANHLQFDVDRLVVDTDCVVTEGWMTMLYPGRALVAKGIEVPEPDAYYRYEDRMCVVWPIDADGLVVGEDSYSGGAGFVGIADRKVDPADLPAELRP
jgi:hypothetical protein